jgi:hypothetical protein
MDWAYTALGVITWLVGGNLLVAVHRRRMRRSMNPRTHPHQRGVPLQDFNVLEWLALVVLTVLAIGFGLRGS